MLKHKMDDELLSLTDIINFDRVADVLLKSSHFIN